MLPVAVHTPVAGSYSSALVKMPPSPWPPATSTCRLGSNVAVCEERTLAMLPVTIHLPGACAGTDELKSAAASFPAAGELKGGKAKTRLVAQRAKSIKTRGLRKAIREVHRVFIEVLSFCVEPSGEKTFRPVQIRLMWSVFTESQFSIHLAKWNDAPDHPAWIENANLARTKTRAASDVVDCVLLI
jgi:hypothetical protein